MPHPAPDKWETDYNRGLYRWLKSRRERIITEHTVLGKKLWLGGGKSLDVYINCLFVILISWLVHLCFISLSGYIRQYYSSFKRICLFEAQRTYDLVVVTHRSNLRVVEGDISPAFSWGALQCACFSCTTVGRESCTRGESLLPVHLIPFTFQTGQLCWDEAVVASCHQGPLCSSAKCRAQGGEESCRDVISEEEAVHNSNLIECHLQVHTQIIKLLCSEVTRLLLRFFKSIFI